MKRNLLFAAALVVAGAVNAQETTPLKVTEGWTADVIAERSPVADYLVGGIDNGSVGFFTKTFYQNPDVSRGFTASRPQMSANNVIYDIDVTKLNTLQLHAELEGNAGRGSRIDGTLTFAAPVSTDKLYLLTSCGNGPASAIVEVVYESGYTDQVEITVADWYQGNDADPREGQGFYHMDRIDRNNENIESPAGGPIRFFDTQIDCDPSEPVVALNISLLEANQFKVLSIMGVSTGDEPVAVTDDSWTDDVFAEARPLNETATAGIDRSEWVVYVEGIDLAAEKSYNYGFPNDGVLVTTTGHAYNIDYANLNATRLTGAENTTTLKLQGQPKASTIYFLAAAGNGPAQIEVEYNYVDETSEVDVNSPFEVLDWCSNSDKFVYTTGRYYNGVSDVDWCGLFEFESYPDPARAIESITVTNVRGDEWSKGIIVGLSMDGEFTTGINKVESEAGKAESNSYNIAGQRVGKDFKGLVIRDGKKMLIK